MSKAFFVTATGTGIGKTHVSCGLIRHWRQAGREARALKPVVSGFDMEDAETDSHKLLWAMEEEETPQAFDAISPWRFEAPLSPDVAAAREGLEIDIHALDRFCLHAIAGNRGRLLIEGIGGAFVPLNERKLVADWIKALDIPAVLVTGSYLGTLSHTIATMEALGKRNVFVSALVISESPDSPMPLAETQAALAAHLPPVPIVVLPREADGEAIATLADILD